MQRRLQPLGHPVLALAFALLAFSGSGFGLTPQASAATQAENAAVAWAKPYADAHNTSYNGLCLTFVFNAYSAAGVTLRNWVNVSIGSNTYPVDIWGHFTHGSTGTGTPPFGALVFWKAANGDRTLSHVALSLGAGNLVSTSDVVADYTHYETMSQHSGAIYLGWWLPDQSGGFPDGSFVSHNGFVYRMAGGAPIYVSSWNAVGGPQPTTGLTDAQFAALGQYPADGTFLDASDGSVFIVAGGAPLYLSNWAAVGGPKPGVGIDKAAVDNAGAGVPWDHLRATPANGTILDASGGGVFIVAGGAPLYLSSWSAIGGPKPGVAVDEWDVDNTANPAAHLRQYPTDGTLLASSSGAVYVVAGGAPLYVSNWTTIGGPQPSVAMDQWDIDNTVNPAAHLRAYPADGTILDASGGGVFVVAGGAPLYVSNWAAIGGPKPGVHMDEWDINNPANPAAHLRFRPADGTFLNSSTGHLYRVAGGTAFSLSGWSIFGGPQPAVGFDQWDVDNSANPAAHLSGTPADGTLVEGLPSHTYWVFGGGQRRSTQADPHAVAVDDAGLASFPVAGGAATPQTTQTAGGGSQARSRKAAKCVVPPLHGLTLTAAKRRLRHAHCAVGLVHRPHATRSREPLRVTRQAVRAKSRRRAGFKVNLTLGWTPARKRG